MSSDSPLWYRVGYALEQARQLPSSGKRTLTGLKDRIPSLSREEEEDDDDGGFLGVDRLVTTGAVALVAKAMDRWGPDRRAGVGALLRAGAAGAAAALLVELVRPLLRSDTDRPELGTETAEHLLTGAGQGLMYGAVLEPWIPGPTLVKGSIFGSVEYALNPAGGITALLGKHSPLGRVPFVLKLLEGLEGRDRKYLEHLAFGVALAVLYGSSASSSGILDDEG